MRARSFAHALLVCARHNNNKLDPDAVPPAPGQGKQTMGRKIGADGSIVATTYDDHVKVGQEAAGEERGLGRGETAARAECTVMLPDKAAEDARARARGALPPLEG